jgi:hypothetical protein
VGIVSLECRGICARFFQRVYRKGSKELRHSRSKTDFDRFETRRIDLTDFEARDHGAPPSRSVRLPFACVGRSLSGQKIGKFPKYISILFDLRV